MDPSIEWRVYTTDHFEIIFNSKYEELAEQYALQAERAHGFLEPIFQETPQKTTVVIDDSTDDPNGLATALPHPTIFVNPVLPTPHDVLGNYGNWAQDLITHEYTHILNFEPAHGAWRPFRTIFGSIIRPNALLPRWYLEGLAVEFETRFTNHGRLRSSLYEGMIRAMAIENRLISESISRTNEVRTPIFPGGSRPYHLGAFLMHRLIRLGGTQVVSELNHRYAERFPFFISRPILEKFGKDYQALLSDEIDHLEERALGQLKKIRNFKNRNSPSAASEWLGWPEDGASQRFPSISPNQLILATVEKTPESEDLLTLRIRESPQQRFAEVKSEVVHSARGLHRLSWTPDSGSIIFEASDVHNRFSTTSDLYQWNLTEKKLKRLTRGLRARDPAVSPGGDKVAFVRGLPGATALALLDLTDFTVRILYKPDLQIRISRPEFQSPNEIRFSMRDLAGIEHVHILDLSQNKVSRDAEIPVDLRLSGTSQRGELFISERSGVSNLYLRKLQTLEVIPLTNTETHVFEGTLDESTQTVYSTEITSYGPRIRIQPIPDSTQPLPKIGSLTEGEWPKLQEPELTTKGEISDYSAIKYLLPRYWIPFVSLIPEGFMMSGEVAASDPVSTHAYALNVAYDSLTKSPSLAFDYTNRKTPVTLDFLASDIYSYLYNSREIVRSTQLGANSLFFLPNLSNSHRGALNWNYIRTENPFISQGRVRQGPSLGYSYSNLSQRGFQIAPEDQGEIKVSAGYFLPTLSEISYAHLALDGVYYWAKGLPKRHVFMMRSNSFWSPANRSILLGTISGGGEFFASLLQNRYIVRGYLPGEFLGWSLATVNLEYHLPLSYTFQGWGIKPLFRRFWSLVFVGDAVTLDGGYFNADTGRLTRSHLGDFYYGNGLELRLDSTLFYHLPATFRFGLFYGHMAHAYGGATPYFGFKIVGL